MENAKIEYKNKFTVEQRKTMTAQMLKELRKTAKLSQKEVAAHLDIPATTYNTYESGRTEPPIEMLVRLSYLYDLPIDILVQRDRTYRATEDAAAILEGYRQQLDEIDKQIKAYGEENPLLIQMRDAMQALIENLTAANEKAIIKKALEQPLNRAEEK